MENPDGPMEIPDQLKKPVPTGQGGSGALRDFLFDAASWEPVAEQVILDVCREGTEAEPAMAGQRLLAEQVLTEPSMLHELVRLLAQADALDPADLRSPPGSPGGIPPDRLDDPPGPTIPTIGRETESSRGTRLATRQRDGVSIVCITGPAGIGKTRLAREITKAIGGQEPARRLEVSLSLAAPWTAGRQLITAPADALLDLLTQLGVRADDAPATLDGRRARYLEELAGQRPAIVIDGAIDESQVLPLLPPTHGSVVVTSRSPLTGPSNLRAEYLQLGPLTRASSRQLVQRIFAATGGRAGRIRRGRGLRLVRRRPGADDPGLPLDSCQGAGRRADARDVHRADPRCSSRRPHRDRDPQPPRGRSAGGRARPRPAAAACG